MGKTIYDIAKEAGVSASTVSRALNGSGYVSDAAMQRIRKATEGYSRSPKRITKNGKAICLVASYDPAFFFVNETYLDAMIGINSVTKEKGYNLLLEFDNENHRCLELFNNGSIEGSILMGVSQSSSLMSALIKHNYPFVLIGDYFDDSQKFCRVSLKDYSMAKEAVQYFIGLGHRKIGFIGGSEDYSPCKKRLNGYLSALAEAGIEVRKEYVITCDDITPEKAVNLAKRLLYQTERVSAILAFNDTIAFAVYEAAKALGIRIPEGLSVIGIDDSEAAKYITPPLTTFKLPTYQKGYKAAEQLFLQMNSPKQIVENIYLDGILMFRDSCARPPEIPTL